MANSSYRDAYFDRVKGIGILLVFLGHSVVYGSLLFTWIFQFHMPLFFLVSGYFFRPEKILSFTTLLRRIFLNIIVPLIVLDVFGLLIMALQGKYLEAPTSAETWRTLWISIVHNLSVGHASGWFLLCLAMAQALYGMNWMVLRRLRLDALQNATLAFALIIGFIVSRSASDWKYIAPFKAYSIPMAFFFFGLGDTFRGLIKKASQLCDSAWWLLLSVVIGILIIPLTQGELTPNMAIPVFPTWWKFCLTSLLGILCVCVAAKGLLFRPLAWIGRNSLILFMSESYASYYSMYIIRIWHPTYSGTPMSEAVPWYDVLAIVFLNILLISTVVPFISRFLSYLKQLFTEKWVFGGPRILNCRLRVYSCLLAVSFLLASAVCWCLRRERIQEYAIADYDSRKTSPVIFSVTPPYDGERMRMDLSFDFSPFSARGAYDNVFQTSGLNNGYRMEIGGAGECAINYTVHGHLMGVPLGRIVDNSVHRLNFHCDEDWVSIEFNGHRVKQVAATKPLFDEVLIGGGFNEDRPFHGTISNVKCVLTTDSRSMVSAAGILALGALVFLSVLVPVKWQKD